MNFRPKDFIIPSVIAHILVCVMLIVLCWGVPTIKIPKKQQFRVNLVELSAPKISPPSKAAVKPVQKVVRKPKPEVKKPTPKPKPEPEKRKIIKKKPVPKLPKKTIKRPTPKPERKILKTPEKVIEKQKDWQKKRELKKKIVKRVVTNDFPDVVWNDDSKPLKALPKLKPLEVAQYSEKKQSELDRLQKNVKEDRNKLRQRITSSFKNAKFSGETSAQQSSVINDYFQRSIRAAIDRSWVPPAGSLISGPVKAVVSFRLYKNGTASNIRIVKSSSVEELNSSAVQAIKDAAFDPFPSDLNRDYLDVEIPFECEPKM